MDRFYLIIKNNLTIMSTVLVSFNFNDPSLDSIRICTSE